TGYTCQDLFYQNHLLQSAKRELIRIAERTSGSDAFVFVGLPLEHQQKLFNVAAVLQNGKILAFIPKRFLPNYDEFYEMRHFTPGKEEIVEISFDQETVPFGGNILFSVLDMEGMVVGCEICEDLWVPNPPSTNHALHGATLLVNLSASNETVGKDSYRKMLVSSTSARLVSGYIYASAGEGESTQDLVFGGHNLICENGIVLAESERFAPGIVYGDFDLGRIRHERRKMNTFLYEESKKYHTIFIEMDVEETKLSRCFSMTPFVPSSKLERDKRCEDILSIQAGGLQKRLEHTKAQKVVIGLSGGLDSTLALLVIVRAFQKLSLPMENILTITMPCFGTTDRTYDNACKLASILGTTLKEIDIRQAVMLHFEQIGQNPETLDVTYENCQARERTQILMDVANKENGLVIGTGDMSELALGFATYNGDHMSMYGVNAGVPKTLVRHLVAYYADVCDVAELKAVLLDVLDTPVSPELLPPIEGEISQKTEDLVNATVYLLSILVVMKSIVTFHVLHDDVLRDIQSFIMAFLLIFVSPLINWWNSRWIYIGQISATIWHNPTTILNMPFAILLFYFSVKSLKSLSIKDLISVGILTMLV
ncbi:MAG: NAD(+) synthase, partial [Clostridiales bacterium]|nr:NAD(+) synthase [Clostridiales bacterium]